MWAAKQLLEKRRRWPGLQINPSFARKGEQVKYMQAKKAPSCEAVKAAWRQMIQILETFSFDLFVIMELTR